MGQLRKGVLVKVSENCMKVFGLKNSSGIIVKGPYENYIKVSVHQGKDVFSITMSVDIMIEGKIITEIPITEIEKLK